MTTEPTPPTEQSLLLAAGLACCALEFERDDGTENLLIRAAQKAEVRRFSGEPLTGFGGLD